MPHKSILRFIVLQVMMVVSLVEAFSANRFTVPFESLKNELFTCMTTDRYGRAWIGTTKGIFVYDGTTLSKYRRTGANHSMVRSLATSFSFLADGRLVATSANGAYVYDPSADEFREVSLMLPNSHVITAFADGRFLLNDYKAGRLVLADSTLSHVVRSIPLSLNAYRPQCWHLSNGNCLIVNADEYILVTPELRVVRRGHVSAFINTSVEESSRLFLATDRGVVTLSLDGRRLSTPSSLQSLTADHNVRFITRRGNILYLGIVGQGILAYDSRTGHTRFINDSVNGSPLDAQTTLLGMDSAGQLWLNMTSGAILGCSIVRTQSDILELEVVIDVANYPRLSSLIAYAFDAKGTLHIATPTGIYTFDASSSTLSQILPAPTETITDIVFDRWGHLFVATNHSIDVYDVSSGYPRRVKRVPVNLYFLIQHAVTDTFTTFACQGSLVSIDRDLNVVREPLPPIDFLAYIHTDRDGKNVALRVGYSWSAYYNITQGYHDIQTHRQPYGTDQRLWTKSGECWEASELCGVIMTKDGTADTLGIEQGLPDNTVYAVQQDRWGNIWATTTNGLVLITAGDHRVVDYGEASGMLYDLSYGHLQKSPTGDVWVNSSGYLLRVSNPSPSESRVAKPVIFGITAVNSIFHGYPRDVSFGHRENHLAITFASVDLACGSLIKYEYRLEGYEHDWHPTDIGQAVYNNLPPGHYTLHVRAHLRGGEYCEASTVTITIRPAFWQTWWFKTLIVLLVIALAVAAVRYYIRTQLSLAQYKLNEEKEYMKLDLYTNLSHIIRTPVSLVSAPFHQLVDGHQWSAKDQRLIDVINKSVDRIMNLTQQFLENWSGVDEASDPMDRTVRLEQKDVVTIIRDTAAVFRPTAVEQGITLQLNTPEQLVLPVDEDKMVKILYNLMSNAMKHTPRGGMITISASLAGHQLHLSVADTGKGIADDKKQKIFDKFFLGALPVQRGQSFGIGLHHTRQLVNLLGGQITVGDNKPHGAVFEVTVLVDESVNATQEETPSTHAALVSDIVLTDAARPHLLIVEDNDDVRAFLADSLRDKYEVSTAVDGMEATGVFETTNIDIVITDVMMPRMDGYALCRWIKENPDFCHIPVCILTAKSAKSDELEGIGVGADAYLKKPFEMPFLFAIVDNLLSNRRKVQRAIMSRLGATAATPQGGAEAEEPEVQLNVRDQKFMEQLRQLMENHLDDDQYGVPELWRDMGFSKTNFYKKVKALTGTTPSQVLQDFRFAKVLELMVDGKYTISEVSYMTGFTSVSTFSRKFRAVYGMSPSEYLKNQDKIR